MSETAVAKTENTKTVEFTPFCGVHDVFDPSAESECVTLCKEDNPEAFAACEEFNKNRPKSKKKTVKKTSRGKTVWGHVPGTQAGLIDVCLHDATEPVTLEHICEFSKGRTPRVLAHVKYLLTEKGHDIRMTPDELIFWNDNPNFTVEDSVPVTNYNLKKKAAAPKKKAEPEKAEPEKAEPEKAEPEKAEPEKAEPKPKKKPAAKKGGKK